MNDRLLGFDAVENVRDYGGYATASGAPIRRGKLFRSGHHNRATDRDLKRFDALGVATIVDLRRASERLEQPSRRPPGFAGLVIESGDGEVVEAPHVRFLRNTDLTEDAVRGFMAQTYRTMPFDPCHIEMFRRYFEALQSGEGAVVIHCAAGKDRTGLLAALTHHALGVSRDDLMEDYLATNQAVRLKERAPEIRRRIRTCMDGRPPTRPSSPSWAWSPPSSKPPSPPSMCATARSTAISPRCWARIQPRARARGETHLS